MNNLRLRVSLLGLTLFTVGCASNSEELLFESLGSDNPLNLSKNQSGFVETDELLSNQTLLLSENTDFKSPRRLQKQEAELFANYEFNREDWSYLANEAAERLFPAQDLRLKSIRKGIRFTYAEFEHFLNERRVHGSKLVLRMDTEGEWYSAFSTLVGEDLLAQAAETHDNEMTYWSLPLGSEVVSEEKVFYPRVESDQVTVYAARQLEVLSSRLQTAYVVWVDEKSNEIIAVFHPEHGLDSATDTKVMGTIHPNAPEDEGVVVELPFVQFQIGDVKLFSGSDSISKLFQYEGEQAHVRLENPFLSVVNNGGDDNEMYIQIDPEMDGEIDFDAFSIAEERTIYYWVMKAREYLEKDLDFHEMDYQIVAMAKDGIRMDNAYFNPIFRGLGAPVLGFGEGDKFLKNTALSKDIILHEYGHAVTHEIYGFKTNYEFRAMNEAFSDFLAASMTDDPAIADGAMVKRDWLRNVQNDMTYDKDYTGISFHYDGQLFSGALWRIRSGMDPKKAERMIHEARLAQADSIREVMTELLIIDESFDDGKWYTPSPNRRLIRKSFLAHGLHSRTEFKEAKTENLTLPWSTHAEHDANCWQVH